MRVFLGLEIPFTVKKHIYDFLVPLKRTEKGWEKPHDYHQTLLFIGELKDEELLEIKKRMDHFSFMPFVLTTKGFHFFNRRVLYLSFENSHELLEIKKQVNEQFSEWVRPEAKPFIPHVTVKRWQRHEYNDLHQGLHMEGFKQRTFEVKNLSLFQSKKDAQANKYHVIYRSKFTKGNERYLGQS